MRPNVDSLVMTDKQGFQDVKPRVKLASITSQYERVVNRFAHIDIILLSSNPPFLPLFVQTCVI